MCLYILIHIQFIHVFVADSNCVMGFYKLGNFWSESKKVLMMNLKKIQTKWGHVKGIQEPTERAPNAQMWHLSNKISSSGGL